MSKSKIAIVIAPSISTWDRATLVKEVIDAVTAADGMALIIPSRTDLAGIDDVITLVDGVVLVCPQECQGDRTRVSPEDLYVREFGRQAIEMGFNAVRIVGDRNFFATDREWQDWAFFSQCRVEVLSLDDVEKNKEELKSFVNGAATFSAFRRLALASNRRAGEQIKSPVTHG